MSDEQVQPTTWPVSTELAELATELGVNREQVIERNAIHAFHAARVEAGKSLRSPLDNA